MTIIVSKNGSNAKIVKQIGFNEERSLQEYIHENPETILIHDLKTSIQNNLAKNQNSASN